MSSILPPFPSSRPGTSIGRIPKSQKLSTPKIWKGWPHTSLTMSIRMQWRNYQRRRKSKRRKLMKKIRTRTNSKKQKNKPSLTNCWEIFSTRTTPKKLKPSKNIKLTLQIRKIPPTHSSLIKNYKSTFPNLLSSAPSNHHPSGNLSSLLGIPPSNFIEL